MSSLTFDTLEYFGKLTSAGVPEAQARVLVEAMQGVVRQYDETSRKELATKGDIQGVRAEIQAVRTDIQDLRLEMKSMEMRLLKWQIGLAVAIIAIIAIMAKGFGWLGF